MTEIYIRGGHVRDTHFAFEEMLETLRKNNIKVFIVKREKMELETEKSRIRFLPANRDTTGITCDIAIGFEEKMAVRMMRGRKRKIDSIIDFIKEREAAGK